MHQYGYGADKDLNLSIHYYNKTLFYHKNIYLSIDIIKKYLELESQLLNSTYIQAAKIIINETLNTILYYN